MRLRLLLTLFVPLVIFAPITLAVVYRAIETAITEQADARGLAIAREISAVVEDQVLTGQAFAAERDIADIVREQPDVRYAFVVDSRGQVFAHSFQGGFPSDLLAVQGAPRPASGVLRVSLDGRIVHDLAAPIVGGVAGAVHVGVSARRAEDSSHAVLLRLSLIGVGIVLVGLSVAWGVSSRVARRIRHIAVVAEAIGEGNLAARVADPARDELDHLGASLDQMGTRLAQASRDREQAFSRAAEAQRLAAVGMLAAGVAHEISNPLTGVKHCLEAIRSSPYDPDKYARYHELMADGIDRAQHVVRQLVGYARPRPLDLAKLDLGSLVRRVAELLGPTAQRAGVRTTVSVQDSLPKVLGDRAAIEQVVTNLLLNAVDAMPEGGDMFITVERSDGHARVRVRDTGNGISQENLAGLFEPFFTTKGSSNGAGLGLSVSRSIVQRHGGRIDVASARGEGATFDVLLPFGGAIEAAAGQEAAR